MNPRSVGGRRISRTIDMDDLIPSWVAHRSATTPTGYCDFADSGRAIGVLRSAARIVADGSRVRVTATTSNGQIWITTLTDLEPAVTLNASDTIEIDPSELPDKYHRCSVEPPSFAALRFLRAHLLVGGSPDRTPHGPATAASLIGAISYDLVDEIETLPAPRSDDLGFPGFLFLVPELALERDASGKSHVVALVFDETQQASLRDELDLRPTASPPESELDTAAAGPVHTDQSDETFASVVTDLKQLIRRGDLFQVVPSRTFSRPCADPLGSFLRLRDREPGTHTFFIDDPILRSTLFGASPEVFVRLSSRDRSVGLFPIAGTRPRGSRSDGTFDHEADRQLETELRNDTKEIAEHIMLVDLARNDIARVSEPGSRHVVRLMDTVRFSRVQHLVSEVRGTVRREFDALSVYAAVANMGTLTGAPKIRAMEVLRTIEPSARGPYGGAVGVYTTDDDLELSIVIRAASVRDGVATVRAGAGVVHDSNPLFEARETAHKARAVLEVLR